METGNVWDVKMGGKSCERSEGAKYMIDVTRGSYKTICFLVLYPLHVVQSSPVTT